MTFKQTLRMTPVLAKYIAAVHKGYPALKESEVVPHAYRVMHEDFAMGIINKSVWNRMLCVKYEDTDPVQSFPETKYITLDKEIYDDIVSGKNTPNNEYAYLKTGAHRAPFSLVTRLVLLYNIQKIRDTDLAQKGNESAKGAIFADEEIPDIIKQVMCKTIDLLNNGRKDVVKKFIEEEYR